jgi:phosphate transport system ATP-binding protein
MDLSPQHPPREIMLAAESVSVEFDDETALYDISISIPQGTITALIGPKGSGKTTFLRLFNRMSEESEGYWLRGRILVNGQDIHERSYKPEMLRRTVGMVFEKPQVFRASVFENIAFGLKLRPGRTHRDELEQKVEQALRKAWLWDEVKEDLHRPAKRLNEAQQQQLCIARALALDPLVLLFDVPTSELDPVSTARVEDLIFSLREQYTIVFSTPNLLQASRLSDITAFFFGGELIEWAETNTIFTNPEVELTQKYITGRFG